MDDKQNKGNRQYIIFYSWQSWLPNNTNRGFIEEALKIAVKAVRSDDTLRVEERVESIELDKDTAGVPGSPDIARTILDKIDQATIFVCDVSLVSRVVSKRATPNPNVLVELGYALKALGEKRLIMVMNTAYGSVERLPFDLKMKRVITYNVPEGSSDKATERKALVRQLEVAIKSILGEIATEQEAKTVTVALSPTRDADVTTFIDHLFAGLDNCLVVTSDIGALDDERLLIAIGNTTGLVTEFAQFIRSAVEQNANNAIHRIYKAFDRILELDNLPQKFPYQWGFYRFMRHELCVTLFHFLVSENRWELIADLLDERFYVQRSQDGKPGLVSYERLADHVELLRDRNIRLGDKRTCLHSDILYERHAEGELSPVLPLEHFMEADYLLYLRSASQTPEPTYEQWTPWSTLYIRYNAPRYLIEAYRKRYAEQLLRPLGVESVEELRALLTEKGNAIAEHFSRGTRAIMKPLAQIDVSKIGTQ